MLKLAQIQISKVLCHVARILTWYFLHISSIKAPFSMDEETHEDILNVICLLAIIVAFNSVRDRHYLLRAAIVRPRLSPWMHLLANGDDRSFLDLTGFTKDAFNELEAAVFPAGDVPTRGRPSSLDNKGKLGLVLFFLGSRMETKFLCLLFGVVPTTANVTINAMLRLLVKNLKRNVAAKVVFPKDVAVLQQYAAMVERREPAVKNVAIFIDGLMASVQCSDDPKQQAMNYNGHIKDTTCNNVLAFAPTGKVVYAAINFPGSWHDATVSSQVCYLHVLMMSLLLTLLFLVITLLIVGCLGDRVLW